MFDKIKGYVISKIDTLDSIFNIIYILCGIGIGIDYLFFDGETNGVILFFVVLIWAKLYDLNNKE